METTTDSGKWYLIVDEMDRRVVLMHATDDNDAKYGYYDNCGLTDEEIEDAINDPDSSMGLHVTPLDDIITSACSYHEVVQW